MDVLTPRTRWARLRRLPGLFWRHWRQARRYETRPWPALTLAWSVTRLLLKERRRG